jgi:hypothetical protein
MTILFLHKKDISGKPDIHHHDCSDHLPATMHISCIDDAIWGLAKADGGNKQKKENEK